MELEINKALLSGALYLASHQKTKEKVLEFSNNITSLIGELTLLNKFFEDVNTVPDYSSLPLPEGIANYTILRKKINMYKKRGIGNDSNIDYEFYVSKIDSLPTMVSDKMKDGRRISIEEREIINWYMNNVDIKKEISEIEHKAKNADTMRKVFGIPYYRLLRMNNVFSFTRLNETYKNDCEIKRDKKEYLENMKSQCESLIAELENPNDSAQNNLGEILYKNEDLIKLVVDCNFDKNIIEGIETSLLAKFKTSNDIREMCLLLEYCRDYLNIDGLLNIFGIAKNRTIKYTGELLSSITVDSYLTKDMAIDTNNLRAECFGKVTAIGDGTIDVTLDDKSFIALTEDLDSLGLFGIHEQSFQFCKYNIKYLQGNVSHRASVGNPELIGNVKIMLADINSKLRREV